MPCWTSTKCLAYPTPTVCIYVYVCMYMCVYACVCMHVCMYIGIDILRFMHEYAFVCGRRFVFMLVIVFAVTICAHTISIDGNLVCFCPVYTLLPQERRREPGDLAVCMDRHMVFSTSSVDMHFVFSCRFFMHTCEFCAMSM